MYVELPPPPGSAEAIACSWWRTAGPAGADPVRVLPDGCVDLVWTDDGLRVAGPDTGPVLHPVGPGELLVGVRVRPGWAGAALGAPAAELRDARIPLGEVWGPPAAARVEGRCHEAADAPGRAAALAVEVARRAAGSRAPDAALLAAVRRLSVPGARVGSLAEELGVGERRLLRAFHDAVGYGPKTLQRVLRLRGLLRSLDAGAGDLARIAAALGYADQAHMTRECTRLTGLSPSALGDERRRSVGGGVGNVQATGRRAQEAGPRPRPGGLP